MRVFYEGDPAAAHGWIGKAQLELARLEARMAATGQTQGAFQHALTFDAYCYGYVLPTGMKAIYIVTTPGAALSNDQQPSLTLPDFVSGVVVGGLIGPEEPQTLKTFYPTVQSAHVHKELKPLVANDSERLAVDLWGAYAEELGGRFGSDRFSQYTRLKPSMYSGRMRQLVQLLMGFGRQPKRSIYDNVKPRLPEEVSGQAPVPMRWETLVKGTGRQIAYDYRFARTHGIFTAGDGSLWLIEIGINRGVVAMPLPLHKMTTHAKFRDKLNTIGDVDGLTAYDTFGGFPTGEPFPIGGEAFDAAVRAGRVVKLIDSLSNFYAEWMPYSQPMGWAFNWTGDEAHNTGYKYGNDGYQRGAHWAIRINLAPNKITPPKDAERLKRVIYQLRTVYPNTIDAALWKIDRMTDDQVAGWFQLLSSSKLDDVYRQLDKWIAPPAASGNAVLTPVSEGFLYWPSKIQPQMKFPDYTLDAVITHDLRPSQSHDTSFRVKCDTTVHVFFIGNELKWVKFYNPNRDYTYRIVDTTIGSCTFVTPGKYHWQQFAGDRTVPPQFYSNDLDFRAEKAPGYVDFQYAVKDLGYFEILADSAGIGTRGRDAPTGTPPRPVYDLLGHWVWRNKMFSLTQHLIFDRGAWTKAALVVPLHSREAYYLGHLDIKEYRSYSDVVTHGKVTDPNFGWYETFGEGEDQKEIITDVAYGSASECAEVADEGPWVPVGSDIKDICYPNYQWHPWFADTEWVHTEEPQVRTLDVYLVSGKTEGAKKVKTVVSNDGLYEGGLWFWPSPDEYGDYQRIRTTENCLGESDGLVYDPDLNATENRVQGSPDLPAMHSANSGNPAVTYIGVVDG